jgi:hypothetical protein
MINRLRPRSSRPGKGSGRAGSGGPVRLGGLAGMAVLIVSLGACGSGSHQGAAPASPSSATTAGATAPKTTVPIGETVVGMHYGQLRGSVSPVASQLTSELGRGNLTAPRPRTLAAAESAIEQFDSWVPGFQAPANLAPAETALVAANRALLADLRSLGSPTRITPARQSALRADLTAWDSARAAADRALST